MSKFQGMQFNISENDAVVSGEEYIGDLPPARKPISGVISKVYLSQTSKKDPILKVLYTATETLYSGFTAWDNVVLKPEAAFKWKPLVTALGISVNDLATRTVTDENDESGAGVRVVAIGDLDLSGENAVPVIFAVKYRKFDEIMQTDVIGVKPRSFQFPVNGS